MKKEDKERTKRMRKLVILFSISAMILAVATYAWFVGLTTVTVDGIDIEIAAIDGLALSLTGEETSWATTVTINEGNYTLEDGGVEKYPGNTNKWTDLIPMSSIGDVDATSSRLKLYEKASMTATKGGFRLISNQVPNSSAEQDGYVVFDLFIKNLSGSHYEPALDLAGEEAIYLTVDSSATVATSGEVGTGIENTIRVGFAQIGRVKGDTTNQSTITGINCTGGGDVTGICRQAQIWEPNDTRHTTSAIKWYNMHCKERDANTVATPIKPVYKTDACGSVIKGIAYPTYAVASEIEADDIVDIYDGSEFNRYLDTTSDMETGTGLLQNFDYFTDTMKNYAGVSRSPFMTLAPNSITKVRVYVWIEGQDVDNYDFAALGKAVAIKFGFTKQRLTEADIDYDGPDVNQGQGPSIDGSFDFTPPVIKLEGDNPMTITKGTTFVDPGLTVEDNKDGTLDPQDVLATGTVDINNPGVYTITYKIRDAANNLGVRTRTVIVEDTP